MYTLFLVSFSLFRAAILHHVVLFLLLQHNSWTFLCFYANSKGHAFWDFHLAYRSNITDAGFPGLGQRYVARAIYKRQRLCEVRYTTYRPIMLPCCSLFPKTAFNQWINVCKTSATKGRSNRNSSDKTQQIFQNAANGSGSVAICNSFTSDRSIGLHEIYRVAIVLTKA